MTKDVAALQANESLAQAARKMRDEDIGTVLVMKNEKLGGIVTDRDIAPDRPIDDAVKLMRQKALRRIPVVDGGRAVGILSIGDLAVERDGKSVLASISAAEPNR